MVPQLSLIAGRQIWGLARSFCFGSNFSLGPKMFIHFQVLGVSQVGFLVVMLRLSCLKRALPFRPKAFRGCPCDERLQLSC